MADFVTDIVIPEFMKEKHAIRALEKKRMMQCLSALCVLGVIVTGLLLTVNAITLEQAGTALVRSFIALVLALWAICVLKGLAVAALPALNAALAWTVIVGLILAGILLIAVVVLRVAKRLPNRVNRERGEL